MQIAAAGSSLTEPMIDGLIKFTIDSFQRVEPEKDELTQSEEVAPSESSSN